MELKEKFGDERRTQVVKSAVGTFSAEDLIPEENVIITVTKSGYVKGWRRTPTANKRVAARGLLGKP